MFPYYYGQIAATEQRKSCLARFLWKKILKRFFKQPFHRISTVSVRKMILKLTVFSLAEKFPFTVWTNWFIRQQNLDQKLYHYISDAISNLKRFHKEV